MSCIAYLPVLKILNVIPTDYTESSEILTMNNYFRIFKCCGSDVNIIRRKQIILHNIVLN